MTTGAKLTIDVTGGQQVRALVDLIGRIRNYWLKNLRTPEDTLDCAEEIDAVIRGISNPPIHTSEAVQQKWPSMRVVRLDGDVCEMRIGGAAWPVRLDQFDAAGDFLDRVRHLWDMRVVWADAGTPVDGDCAKELLVENERMRSTIDAVFRDLMDIGEGLHISKMRCLHARDPKKHGPVPSNGLGLGKEDQ